MTQGSLHMFTPRISPHERVQMFLDGPDFAEVTGNLRRLGWQAAITDQMTGRKYLVRGAECEQSGCCCDAVVVREMMAH